jgi:hypothetical protein
MIKYSTVEIRPMPMTCPNCTRFQSCNITVNNLNHFWSSFKNTYTESKRISLRPTLFPIKSFSNFLKCNCSLVVIAPNCFQGSFNIMHNIFLCLVQNNLIANNCLLEWKTIETHYSLDLLHFCLICLFNEFFLPFLECMI